MNLIYTPCTKSVDNLCELEDFIDVESISNKLFEQMREHYKFNKIDPYKNRKVSIRNRSQHTSPQAAPNMAREDLPQVSQQAPHDPYAACFQEGIDQHTNKLNTNQSLSNH